MSNLEKLEILNQHRNENAQAERICSELSFLSALSAIDGRINPETLGAAIDFVTERLNRDGAITKGTVSAAEKMLAGFSPVAKSYRHLFVSHAHIDMNWLWGYNETSMLTVDTFRTILDLMKEYPKFTFAQSQASTYEVIEKYAPDMIPEIRKRVREGRWEVTASEWVEPDKNMPNGESLTRHILQTKKYLTKLLGVTDDYLCIDFVPDTFGHNINVPEVLSDGGVKFMYHCRGADLPTVYNYTSPSGKKVLCYREFDWYNSTIEPRVFEFLPDFCGQTGMDIFLTVYGVGDHGGGPTRRDIERIIEYSKWPLTPDIRFGTLHEFFAELEKKRDSFPSRESEVNFIFTGCYTTQTRIKMSNRIAEARLNEAEALLAEKSLFENRPENNDRLEKAWRNTLFNHFHDILPGSGLIETREFALGRFQEAMASVTTSASEAMKRISALTDTSGIPFDRADGTVSEGAGVGFNLDQSSKFRFSVTERGRGKIRAYTVFNPTQYDREDVAEIVVWDYLYDVSNLSVTYPDGGAIPFVLTGSSYGWWGHEFKKLIIRVKVPAFGYTTVIMKPNLAGKDGVYRKAPIRFENHDGFINDDPFVLENEYIKAVFDRKTCRLTSLYDKETDSQLIDAPSCMFRLVHENPLHGMIAWRVGSTMSDTDLNASYDARVIGAESNGIRDIFSYVIEFGRSNIQVTVSLDKGSRVINFETKVDWDEKAEYDKLVPRLDFSAPVSYRTEKLFCDVPYGEIERPLLTHDVPCLSYAGLAGSDCAVGIVTDTKYGFRGTDRKIAVSLIRSSYHPDPYSDRGIHNIKIGVICAPRSEFRRISDEFCHPVSAVPATGHSGPLALTGQAISVTGAGVSCVKPSEDGLGVAVRLLELNGSDATAAVKTFRPIKAAFLTDSNEKNAVPVSVKKNGTLSVKVPKYSVVTLKIEF